MGLPAQIVVGEVARRVLEPERLGAMLAIYVKPAAERDGNNKERLAKLRHSHKGAEAGITRLLQLVENGLMDAGDAALRERLIGLKLQRDELSKDIGDTLTRMSSNEPQITPNKIQQIAVLLRDKLHHGPPEIRQAYARMLMKEVRVTDEEIRISGSTAILARAASDGMETSTPAVLSSVREWRASGDAQDPIATLDFKRFSANFNKIGRIFGVQVSFGRSERIEGDP